MAKKIKHTADNHMGNRTLRVLADDPATKNYGRVLMKVDVIDNRLLFKIVRAGLVKHRIQSEEVKTDISKVINRFKHHAETALIKNGPLDLYCAERFMPRGGGGCVQHGEVIAMMLALNVLVFQGTKSKLIPAVSWKTQIKRYYDLKQLYLDIKPCPDHLLDATLIGLYACYTHLGIKPYSTMQDEDIVRLIKKLRKIGRVMALKEAIQKRTTPRVYKPKKRHKKK